MSPLDSPWSAPASLAPDSALLDRVGRVTAEPRHDCVFIGPQGAGKSSVLGALSRACRGGLPGDLEISLLPGRSLAELTGEAALFLSGATPSLAATGEPVSYDFQMTVRSNRAGTPQEMEVTIQDWPGDALFGSRDGGYPTLERHPRAQRCLQAAREASCLVLCVDAMKPERSFWEALLPQLLHGLATSAGHLLPRLGTAGRRDLPPILSPKRQLPHERVLILFNKMDLVCTAAAEAVESAGMPRVGPISPVLARLARRPRDFVRHLDPLRLAEDRMGGALLAQLRPALRREARLAVGLASAWGFDGMPGRAGRAPALDLWSPFGLREMVLFLATGEARHPVELIPSAPAAEDDDHWRELASPRSGKSFLRFGGHR